MKIWALSDTHSLHRQIEVPTDIDLVLYGGDSTNYYNLRSNLPEYEDFSDWFTKLPIKHKVIIAGNHDAWATKQYIIRDLKSASVHYLEHELCEIEGVRIVGSPYTPTFGNWYFMKDRSKLDSYWKLIDNCDILLTHGPPQGILDLSRDPQNVLEFCGDKSLLKHVLRIKPKFHIFGHIHDFEDCLNQGIRIKDGIQFMNVSCVEDGQFKKGPKSHGIIFNYGPEIPTL